MSSARKVIPLPAKGASQPGIFEADGQDPQFLHSVLCQVALPRNPTSDLTFVRTSGKVSIALQAGLLFDGLKMVQQPLPSGTRPRLILLHICSEAVRKQSPDIAIGDSVRAFLRELRIDAGGENMRQFRSQMKALAACNMVLGCPSDDGPMTISAKPVERFAAWTTDDEGQYTAWTGRLVLGRQFFETLVEHAVPLEREAIGRLKNNALGLDVYAWLAHRLCRVKTPAGVRLSWGNLQEQFGTEYASTKDFKKRFLEAMRKAVAVYPAAHVDQVRGGLILKSSPPPIAKRGVVVALPAPAATPVAAKPIAAPEPRTWVSEDALDRVRTAAPGWDRQWLLARYQEWTKGKPTPANIDAAFLGWARKFTKGKAPQ